MFLLTEMEKLKAYTDSDGLPLPKRYWAILSIGLAITVSVRDGAIANVALPTIASDFRADPASSIWIVNAYQLAITISLLSFSSLGDIIGYRRIYLGGLLVFSAASLACALSESLVALALARMVQGFGAAAITSVNTALVRLIYPQRYLGRGMGINAVVVAVSAAAGPTVAAGILSVASWPWLFSVNIPIGIAAFLLGRKFLPYNDKIKEKRKFDVVSGIMNAFTFGLLIFSIDSFAHGLRLGVILPGIAALLVVGFFYIRRQLREPYPLLPVDLLKIPIFSLSVTTSICSFTAQMLALVSMPFFLQRVAGRTEVETGLLLTCWPLATMIFAPVAGRLMERVHAGLLGGIGLSVFAAGLLFLSLLPDHPGNSAIIWRMAVCGAGFGLFQTPNNSIMIASAPKSRSGGASGMLGTARLLGQTVGAALVALLFSLSPDHTMEAALTLACIFAAGGATLSFLRIRLPEPAGLRSNNK